MMTDQDTASETRKQRTTMARQWAVTVVTRIARETGARILTRRPWPGAASTFEYAEPGAGIAIARAVELAARSEARQYIKYARADGQSWQQIGAALGITGGGVGVGASIAEAAYEYAVGPRDTWNSDPSFAWTCPACGQGIHDRGPYDGPRDAERGHADGCGRLAATVAAWDAQWADE